MGRGPALRPQGTLRPEALEIFARLDSLGLKQRELAQALGIEENKISKTRSGERQFKGPELLKARQWLSDHERRTRPHRQVARVSQEAKDVGLRTEFGLEPSFDGSDSYQVSPDLPEVDTTISYVPIEVLPTFGGMGGGGNGEGDTGTALIPRALIEDVLRGQPKDFLLVNVRGDSMEPDFRHDDQILIDKRDTSPSQPGPFALWDGEWGEYVVKNVERLANGEVRLFSSNPKYTGATVASEQTRIIGRPVWFGRRL